MIFMDTGLYQQQRVTTQLVQDMSILQMSTEELDAYLKALALENPVIELKQGGEESYSDRRDRQRKLEWLSSLDRPNRSYHMDDQRIGMDHFQSTDGLMEDTLESYLWSQLMLRDYSKGQRQVLTFLISSLDRDGYFREAPEEAAVMCGVSPGQIRQLLEQIRNLDPPGVGARDLEDCLMLQAQRLYPEDQLLQRLIGEHLSDIAKNHLRDVSRKLGVSMQEISDCCKRLRTLNPKPGALFSGGEEPRYIRPDALVEKNEDRFDIILCEDPRRSFEISLYYRELAKTTEDPQARQYLRSKIQQAESVTSSLAIRSANLSRVLAYLVSHQDAFFRYGPGHEKPMKLSDLAEEFQIHISTVSRAMRGKYLQCAWGVFPLSHFLTGVAAVSDGNQQLTREQIKDKLRQLILEEDKKRPCSDETLCRLLLERYHITISRRTVNKYRQEMNIPDRSGRRVWDE